MHVLPYSTCHSKTASFIYGKMWLEIVELESTRTLRYIGEIPGLLNCQGQHVVFDRCHVVLGATQKGGIKALWCHLLSGARGRLQYEMPGCVCWGSENGPNIKDALGKKKKKYPY